MVQHWYGVQALWIGPALWACFEVERWVCTRFGLGPLSVARGMLAGVAIIVLGDTAAATLGGAAGLTLAARVVLPLAFVTNIAVGASTRPRDVPWGRAVLGMGLALLTRGILLGPWLR